MLCISGLNAVSPACARLSSDISLRSLFCLQYLTWHFLSQDKAKIYELAFPFRRDTVPLSMSHKLHTLMFKAYETRMERLENISAGDLNF